MTVVTMVMQVTMRMTTIKVLMHGGIYMHLWWCCWWWCWWWWWLWQWCVYCILLKIMVMMILVIRKMIVNIMRRMMMMVTMILTMMNQDSYKWAESTVTSETPPRQEPQETRGYWKCAKFSDVGGPWCFQTSLVNVLCKSRIPSSADVPKKSLSFRWKTRTFAQLYSWTPLHVAWLLACQNLLARWGIHVCGEGDTIF